MTAAPGRLSPERLAGLLREARDGSVEARNEVALANLGLVHAAARRATSSGASFEDAVSVGVIALFDAVQSFDPSMGFQFSTWATCRVWTELKEEERRERRRSRHDGRDQSPDQTPEDPWLRLESAEDLHKLKDILDRWRGQPALARYAKILGLYFGMDGGDCLSFREIAAECGLSRQRVNVLADRAVGWLCEEFGERGRTCSPRGRVRRKGVASARIDKED